MSISELSLRVLLYSGHVRALTESLLLGSDNPSPFRYQFGSHVNGMFILHYPCFLVIDWQILDLGTMLFPFVMGEIPFLTFQFIHLVARIPFYAYFFLLKIADNYIYFSFVFWKFLSRTVKWIPTNPYLLQLLSHGQSGFFYPLTLRQLLMILKLTPGDISFLNISVSDFKK